MFESHPQKPSEMDDILEFLENVGTDCKAQPSEETHNRCDGCGAFISDDETGEWDRDYENYYCLPCAIRLDLKD